MMKSRLTLEEHKELGADLHEIRNKIGEYISKISTVYSKSSKQCKLTLKAQEAIDKLRWEMEGSLFIEKPKEFSTRIYFPGSKRD